MQLKIAANFRFCVLFSVQQKSILKVAGFDLQYLHFLFFQLHPLFFFSSPLSPALGPLPGGFGALGVERIPNGPTTQHSAGGHRQYISRDCRTKAISIGILPVGSLTIAGESCFGESRAQEDPVGSSGSLINLHARDTTNNGEQDEEHSVKARKSI